MAMATHHVIKHPKEVLIKMLEMEWGQRLDHSLQMDQKTFYDSYYSKMSYS